MNEIKDHKECFNDGFFVISDEPGHIDIWLEHAVDKSIDNIDEYYYPVMQSIKEKLDTHKRNGRKIQCTVTYHRPLEKIDGKKLSKNILRPINELLEHCIYQAFENDIECLDIELNLCPVLTSNAGRLLMTWGINEGIKPTVSTSNIESSDVIENKKSKMYIYIDLKDTSAIMHDLSTD